MFLGQFSHSLDDKGRLTVPARYRDLLALEGAYILQGFDQNLMVLTASTFDAISRRINSMSLTDPTVRVLRRLVFSTADRVDVDRAGRILIPQFLREHSAIDKDVKVVGVGDYFEIWSPAVWEKQVSQLQDVESNAQRFMTLELSSGQ
jgi:MraZ protein